MKDASSTTRISNVIRRKLVEVFNEHCWWGNLDEIDFLKRIYELSKLPSTDNRYDDSHWDIVQHRVNNNDWSDDWVFNDERFNLKSDDSLLRFLAETVHPEVRSDPTEVYELVRKINGLLRRDGWVLTSKTKISGFPVYSAEVCDPTDFDVPESFPLDFTATIASLAELLKTSGNARDLAIIASSNASVMQVDSDGWNGGTDYWVVTFHLEPGLFGRLTADERRKSEKNLESELSQFFRSLLNDQLNGVTIVPNGIARQDWRSAAQHWLSGQGITNQGRVRSENIASLECDGLLFRSEPEKCFYRALKAAGVTFAPLPVFLRGGASYSRFEPDFVIVKDGRILVVEIDGDTYHSETPADADARLVPLRHEGAHTERVKASECASDTQAKACVTRMLGILEKLKQNR